MSSAKPPLSAREEILGRIRNALPGDPVDARASHGRIDRLYTRNSSLAAERVVELLIDRLLDYDTEIIQLGEDERNDAGIAEAVATGLSHQGETSLLAAESFPQQWLPASVRVVRDLHLSTPELDAESAVITTCEAAVASTGTIILVHCGAQGRRALTLLPDHHLCLVRRDQVYETMAEAFEAIAPHSRKAITTISGPSATSDIEMTRIRGVHGPRRLTVILYGSPRRFPGTDSVLSGMSEAPLNSRSA